LVLLALFADPFNILAEYDLLGRAIPTPALGLHVGGEPASGRGGTQEESAKTTAIHQPAEIERPVAGVRWLRTSDLLHAPVVHTTIPDRPRRQVITYVVREGDSVLDIATKFNLSPETVTWANGDLERDPNLLRPGQELTILPIDGVYHTAVKGDTLSKIAHKYGVRVEDILHCEYNDIGSDGQIAPGQKLIAPGGVKPYVPRQITAYNGPIPSDAKRGTGIFAWPTSGRVTDRFGFRTYSGRWHTGIDIAARLGAPIYAADAGFVTFTGRSRLGYGNLVIIDHGNGFGTYYAHLSVTYVSMGQSVDKGTLIGAIGSTGNSTGPHLHFEIRHRGIQRDPELDLP
jgi:murein DD-endopeptidase MepM/ murein hydrolase activator NlpD